MSNNKCSYCQQEQCDCNIIELKEVDEYRLTRIDQKTADLEMVKVSTSRDPAQLLADLNYKIKHKYMLTTLQKFEEIGEKLIENSANVSKTAHFFLMDAHELRTLIRTEPILYAYWQHAFRGLKSLVDDKVIELLEEGDKRMIQIVYKNMYAGRGRGGYNPNEFGLSGYDDPLSAEQHEAVKADIEGGNPDGKTIVMNFGSSTVVVKDGESVHNALIESFIDADIEDEEK